jgi:hypothetical protein
MSVKRTVVHERPFRGRGFGRVRTQGHDCGCGRTLPYVMERQAGVGERLGVPGRTGNMLRSRIGSAR